MGVIFDSSGNNLFGTTVLGGSSSNAGLVYKLSTSGTSFSKPSYFTTYGINPRGGVVYDVNNNLYGTTSLGGAGAGNGVIYELPFNGSTYSYSTLHTFSGGSSDGANPYSGLTIDSSGNLYGTTVSGGASGYGVLFKLTKVTGGFNYSVLYSFAGGTTDGANPYSAVTLDSSGNLWGTTANGGASSKGVIYKYTP